jgi:hypothetical protein
MATPYIANEITLELDLTGKTAADGTTGGKVEISCWIQAYNIAKDGGGNETVDVATMCPTGLYKLVNKSAGGGYTLNLDYVNDWCTTGTSAAANSLSWLLVKFPNATSVPFKIIDRAGCSTGITITGSISQLPDFAVGGQAGQVSSVSGAAFPLTGKPTIVAAAAAAAATGATAGTPGAWTPAGSLTPLDLTAANALALSLGAKWATGQYILTSTKDEIHWDGTKFAAGRAV